MQDGLYVWVDTPALELNMNPAFRSSKQHPDREPLKVCETFSFFDKNE